MNPNKVTRRFINQYGVGSSSPSQPAPQPQQGVDEEGNEDIDFEALNDELDEEELNEFANDENIEDVNAGDDDMHDD